VAWLKVDYAALSDIGFRRRNNEDAYVAHLASDQDSWIDRGHFFMVADGMGGHAVGELASKIAVDTVAHTYRKRTDLAPLEALEAALLAGNAAIHDRGRNNADFARMGTTCSTLVLSKWGAILGHVGDSRVYRVRENRIEQLTFDHSLQWELLRTGRFAPEEVFLREPRNVITRSLGPEPSVEIDLEGPYRIKTNDVYVLCSDGLSNHLKDDEIGMIAQALPPNDACTMMVDLANLRGGSDNITALVVRVAEFPDDDETGEAPPELRTNRQGLSWGWLLAFTASILVLVFGEFVQLSIDKLRGSIIQAIGVVAFGSLVIALLRHRRTTQQNSDLPSILPGTPYRTASARLSRKFVSETASLAYALQRSAIEEGWSTNWTEHDRAYRAAKTALAERRYAVALQEFGRALHAIMQGVQQQRKQREMALRWGNRPPPSPNPKSGDTPPPPTIEPENGK
jgi:protein phosphatase